MSDLSDIKMLLKGIDARLTVLEQHRAVSTEGRNNGKKADGGDGPVRVQPVPVVRTTNKKVARQEPKRNGREDRGNTGRKLRRNVKPKEEVKVDLDAKRKAEVAALDGGVHGAVASFSPPGEPQGPPSRSMEVKPLWNVGDVIPCTECKEPIYDVVKALTTASKLADLQKALEPYGEGVPRLDGTTPIKHVGGVWVNCPRCFALWSVTVA